MAKERIKRNNAEKRKDRAFSKIEPRLRMMNNGSDTVNKVRARRNSTVVHSKKPVSTALTEGLSDLSITALSTGIPSAMMTQFAPVQKKRSGRKVVNDRGSRNEDPPVSAHFNVFITLKKGAVWGDVITYLENSDKGNKSILNIKHLRSIGNLCKVQLTAMELDKLAYCDAIASIEGSQSIMLPSMNINSYSNAQEPIRRSFIEELPAAQNKVIIGIIDVGGFDFAHKDFIKRGKTRFHSIWDQKGSFRESPQDSFDGNDFIGLDYGSVITKRHIDEALTASSEHSIPIHSLEPQSQQLRGSHATHVASIAAGNSGVCPNSIIVGVLVSLPLTDQDRRATFTDSSRIADAVDYIIGIAEEENLPVSINISLGTNGHAHDGSSPVNRWIDYKLTEKGKAITVAAGNTGQEKPLSEDDFGYAFGRIHTSGQIPNAGLKVDLEWHVIGNGNVDVTENELEIWYEPQDRFSVLVKPPGLDWIGPVGPQKVIENLQLPDDTFLSVYNNLFYQSNGNNHISIYLSPFFAENEDKMIGIKSGLWKVRIVGDEIRDGRFDAWVERDGFSRISQDFWQLPSFFSESTNVDNKSINSLACGHNVIAVGNYDAKSETINISSSQGPTRDNRNKPEIIAPGTDIVAANGFVSANESQWISMTGTSMASPYVCGLAGLLLERSADLTSPQIAAILKRTSSPLPGIGYEWKDDVGYGIVNPLAAFEEVQIFQGHLDITDQFKSE